MHTVGKRFYARPILRWGVLICVAATMGNVILVIASSGVDAAGWRLALQTLIASYPAIFLVWLGYPLLRHPVVQVTAEAVEWKPLVGGRRKLLVSDISSTHWQDSFDLRLRTSDGEESLRVGTLSAKSRKRLASLFDGMLERRNPAT